MSPISANIALRGYDDTFYGRWSNAENVSHMPTSNLDFLEVLSFFSQLRDCWLGQFKGLFPSVWRWSLFYCPLTPANHFKILFSTCCAIICQYCSNYLPSNRCHGNPWDGLGPSQCNNLPKNVNLSQISMPSSTICEYCSSFNLSSNHCHGSTWHTSTITNW